MSYFIKYKFISEVVYLKSINRQWNLQIKFIFEKEKINFIS